MKKPNQTNRKSNKTSVTDKTSVSGITLIALIITIIIMLILAGITISLTIGQDGIISGVQEAGKKHNNSVTDEQNDLDSLYGWMNNWNVSENPSENLPENTPENPQAVGTMVKLPAAWEVTTPNYVSVADGSIITSSTKIANVYAVSIGDGNTVPVPHGFYYVGGNFDTGVVISDKEEDSYVKNKRDMTGHSDAINLIGNQFVWIPCTTAEYVKSNWANGSQGNVTGRSNCYWGTEVNSLEVAQIEKYGGFYVSRYEAGLPQGTTEFTGSLANTSNHYNAIEGAPQSKAGLLPWNFIDWNNSQIKAKKMYETKTNVRSGLITDTQWDVMINKIASKEGVSLTDSKAWGNYYTGEAFTYTGRAAEYKTSDSKLYAFGQVVQNATKANNTYYLLSTGASEHNKAYNLYDVAGNLWEWTEESAAVYNSVGTLTTNRMLRGGSFRNVSSTNPACFRHGGNAAAYATSDVGFRGVLYIQ